MPVQSDSFIVAPRKGGCPFLSMCPDYSGLSKKWQWQNRQYIAFSLVAKCTRAEKRLGAIPGGHSAKAQEIGENHSRTIERACGYWRANDSVGWNQRTKLERQRGGMSGPWPWDSTFADGSRGGRFETHFSNQAGQITHRGDQDPMSHRKLAS